MPEICINYPILHIHAAGDDDDDVTQSDYKMADKRTERRATHTHTYTQTDRQRQRTQQQRGSDVLWPQCGFLSLVVVVVVICAIIMQHLYAALYGTGGAVGSWGAWPSLALLRLKRFTHFKRNLHLPLCFQYQHCSLFLSHSLTLSLSLTLSVCLSFSRTAEGAFKKLKPEPNSGLSTVSAGITSPGSGLSSLSQHAGHTPTTASCPTPARRRHRTTFTQVSTPPPLSLQSLS